MPPQSRAELKRLILASDLECRDLANLGMACFAPRRMNICICSPDVNNIRCKYSSMSCTPQNTCQQEDNQPSPDYIIEIRDLYNKRIASLIVEIMCDLKNIKNIETPDGKLKEKICKQFEPFINRINRPMLILAIPYTVYSKRRNKIIKRGCYSRDVILSICNKNSSEQCQHCEKIYKIELCEIIINGNVAGINIRCDGLPCSSY